MKFQLPKIYPITDERVSGIPAYEQFEGLIAGGASLIQLRDKHSSSRELYESATNCLSIARAAGARIIINDRVDIALALKADGVHLGQDDLPCEQARSILGQHAIIGFSTHSPEQAKAALALPVDYIAIGPIFSTSTKENPDAVVGLEGLSRVKSIIGRFPLVAIGGITSSNVRSILEGGADSAAMISGLVADNDSISQNLMAISEQLSNWC